MESLASWEKTCRKCGRCCYEKIEINGTVYYTDVPCEKLDLDSRLCTVYAQRTERQPGCVRLTPDIVARGFLPADCPYVAGVRHYPAPVLFEEGGEGHDI